ncbi:PAS domain S-box protein [Sphingomonas humi]|uniref:histidine kinase n=1 Tax=Sphingomonas humi TaxID=335630 RepID=A0ABP7SD35_9SPHN
MDQLTSRPQDGFSSDLWQQLADHVSQLVWMADGDGRPFWFNRRCADYTNKSVEELNSEGWSSVIHPEDIDRVRSDWFGAAASGTSYESLLRLRGRDGHYRHFLSRAEPYRDTSGAISNWFGTSTDVTEQIERARAEDQLQLSEEQFRTTAEAVPGLLFVTNAAGENIYVNRFYKDYTGRSDDVLGTGWAGVIHPDDLAAVMAETERARAKGEEFKFDFRLRRHDGAFRWHSTKASPTRNDKGEIVRWVGVSLDVHDQREAEEKARAAAEEIEAIYASAPIGLTQLDRDLRYVRINDRLAEINGIPAAAHVGQRVTELLPSLASQVEEPLQRVLSGDEVWGLEISGDTPAQPGTVRTWRENWLPVRGRDGQITGIAISAEEVTAQKAAELKLAHSEAQFRTLAEALPGMLFITTEEGGNSYVNETFATFSGLPKEELLGTGWTKLIHPDDMERTWQAWADAKAGDRPYEVEYRMRNHAGDYRWIAARAMKIPERDSNGRETWVGTCIDIHATKAAQQELSESEARVRIATEHAEVGFWDVDEVNEALIWPPVVRRMFGVLSDRPVTMEDFYNGLHPDDRPRTAAAYAAAADPEQRALYDVEYRTVGLDDGVVRWVAAKGRGLFDADGRCLRVLGTAIDITDRKTAEEALRRSEERYRALFESMDQGFCIVRVSFDDSGQATDYRFTDLNPAFTRQSGLSQDVLGRSIHEAVPGLEQIWFERYGRIVKTGQSERFIEFAGPTGRWFEVYGFPIGDADDQQVAILFNDVTDRVQRETDLRESEQELRLRLNAIPQMVWSTLPDGYHDFYNDRWYEFTGTPLGSTDGEGWNGMFHPEDQARAWEGWNESLRTGMPYEIEYRLRHHTGTYRWVLGRALPIRNAAGEILRWMGTCTDIDDRIAADQALRESEARLRAILDAVPVGLIFADMNGRLTGSNDRIVDYLGHDLIPSATTASYKEDYVAYHGDGRQVESHEYPLARALAGEQRPELEARVRRSDGSLRWLRYVAAPICGDEGRITGGVVASIDIDREKRLTESLEREVEKVIAEREAAQEALRQSQKLEAMGQLTGGVAHDFNNLLTPIIGSLDLLQRKQILDARTGRLVEGALASAEKARVLVQRLLAFARRQPLKPQAIDLNRVVAEMSELMDSTSGPRIRVLTDLTEELPPALADSNQLEMALLNLSVNARDAMPEGGTLTIAARLEEEGAGHRLGLGADPHVVLSVSDTGLGMDEETRRRAIEPFFSTKGLGKGTGLGLSMVHGLAAQLGGALDIRSALGLGTTIELWLPLANRAVSEGEGPAQEAEAQGSGTVLLVDDEELVRASTAGMLADLGYRVIEADSGEAALALIADGLRPDLLVTDQLMPGVSGTDLAVRLRERSASMPVLIVSGYADLDSLSPAFPHLSKPFRQAELAAALEKVTA